MMKKTLKLMLVVSLAFGMFACGEKQLTENDMKEAEATLFNEDGSIKSDMAPKVTETYLKFVEQNPDAPSAPLWLYHAFEVNVMLKNAEQIVYEGEVSNRFYNIPGSQQADTREARQRRPQRSAA